MMRNRILISIFTAVLFAFVLPTIFSCRKHSSDATCCCIVNLVHDNMPYQDKEYVDSLSPYPRKLILGCSIINMTERIVSVPFKTLDDTTCLSCFKVKLNHFDDIPIRVHLNRNVDLFNIMPHDTIYFDIAADIRLLNNGEVASLPLRDLLPLVKIEYNQDSYDKIRSKNEMAALRIGWNKNLIIMAEKKGNRKNLCGPGGPGL